MNESYTFKIIPLLLMAGLPWVGSCSDDGESDTELCGECLECQECRETESGYQCMPSPAASLVCGEDANLHWLDSCGNDDGVARECSERSACVVVEGGSADCVCLNNWTGDQCDLCPGNWDPEQDCAACIGDWDPESGCEECLGNRDPLTDCEMCLGNWDDATDCTECAGSWTDQGDDCGTCPDNWDPSQDCAVCSNSWSGDDCQVCPGNWDDTQDCAACRNNWTGSDCAVCPENWDASADCNACLGHWDESSDCEECLGNWSKVSSCTECEHNWTDNGDDCGTCPGNWDPVQDCAACTNSWTGADCDVCPGNWDESSGCSVCLNNWVDNSDDCGTCPGNWDPDQDCAACTNNWTGASCSECPGNWDPLEDCAECLGNWDPATGCTTCLNSWQDNSDDCGTCPYGWDVSQNCAACAGNYDPATDCTACRNSWSGYNCQVCPTGYDPSTDCSGCFGNLDLASGCTLCENNWVDDGDDCGTCPGNWDPYSDCAACGTNWTGPDCDVCPGNWDSTLNCAVCANSWTGSDCDVCPGNWDPSTNCAECIAGWNPSADCAECAGNWDTTTGCTGCLDGWSGTDCETQDYCVRFVDALSTATAPDGHAWSRAFTSLQPAIDSAYTATLESGGPATCDVWVAEGVYFTYETDENDTIQMMPGVEIYGGFDGSEQNREERDQETNATVLDGRALEGGSDYVNSILTGSDDAVLSGFTIRYGGGPSGSKGGGLHCIVASPTIEDCIFHNNFGMSAGAVYLYGSQAELRNCLFYNNYADMGSGVLEIREGAPLIEECEFVGNRSSPMNLLSTSATVSGCSFLENECFFDLTYNGCVRVYGGSAVLENSVFARNVALETSGALYLYNSPSTIRHNTFWENECWGWSTDCAGAVLEYSTYESATIVNNIFWDNYPVEIAQKQSSTVGTTVSYSVVKGGYPGTGNLSGDPLFRDPEGGDFSLTTGSSAVDAADGHYASTVDMLGVSRWDNSSVVDALSCGGDAGCIDHADVGAFELIDGACPGHWDPIDGCASCLNNWEDNGDDCGTCPANWDPTADCALCVNGFDEAADCLSCANSWEGAACDTCPGNWDPSADCAACLDGFDPDSDCTTCLPGWSGTSCDVQSSCVRYVDLDTPAPVEKGLSWTGAFSRIQDAIDSASTHYIASGQTETCQVWVKAGTYYVFEGSHRDTVLLKPGVELYGGFDGTETLLSARDIEANETIISGWHAANDNYYKRVLHVITGSDDAIIDGFEIREGTAYDSASTDHIDAMGGGMLNWSASPTVRNCRFISNKSTYRGAAVANYASQAMFESCEFSGNALYGENEEGGVSMANLSSQVELVNCTMAEYLGSDQVGCTIISEDSTIAVQNSILWCHNYTNNTVHSEGAGAVQISYSLVCGGYTGTGNISSTPVFADYSYPAYDLSPTYDSPVIDAADGSCAPTTDRLGHSRVDDTATANTGLGPPWADMGAVEYQ